MKINIILADDHHVIREGLRLLLESEKDLLVLAEADSGRGRIPIFRVSVGILSVKAGNMISCLIML